MVARIRNSEWEEDIELENDLKEKVSRNLQQSEIVDFMKVKYPMYSWILRTLSRRLHHFGITYTDYSVDIEEVREAVEKEMKGAGRLLGYYRSLHKKVREYTDSRSQEIWCMTLWQTYMRKVLRKEVAWGCQNVLRKLGLSPQM